MTGSVDDPVPAPTGVAVSASIDGLTCDAFLGGQLKIYQPAKGYRAGIDAILLAATVVAAEAAAEAAVRVLDVGAGVGTVGLAIAVRLPVADVVLLEREPALAEIARRNIAANGLGERVVAIEADVGAPAAQLEAYGAAAQFYDHVVANPPYHDEARGTAAPDGLKAASHAMPEDGLDAWLRAMARAARPGGRATLIHKAEALDRVLAAFRGRFGGVVVRPIYSRAGASAIRVIVRGVKGSRAPLTVLPGLVLHGEGNAFHPEVAPIFRDGAGLALDV